MEIVRSVRLSEIDPVFFETSYYVVQWDRASEIRMSFYSDESMKRRPSTLLKHIPLIYVIPQKRLKGLRNFALNSFCDKERLGYDDARLLFPKQFEQALTKIRDVKPRKNNRDLRR